MAPNFPSVTWHSEAFHGLRVQGVKVLILVGALFLVDGGRRTEGKKKTDRQKEKSLWGTRIFLGLDPLCWLCRELQVLGAIKG
jgi:hypothetical protein